MRKRILYALATLWLLTACNPNTPDNLAVAGKTFCYNSQYLRFTADSVRYYGLFTSEQDQPLNGRTFAYEQAKEVVTVYAEPNERKVLEHLIAYQGFVQRNGLNYEQITDPNYQDHQPANPATWSPAGKMYRVQYSTWADTLEFVTAFRALYYSRPKFYRLCSYELDYPVIKMSIQGESYLGEFRDTTSLRLSGTDYEIIK